MNYFKATGTVSDIAIMIRDVIYIDAFIKEKNKILISHNVCLEDILANIICANYDMNQDIILENVSSEIQSWELEGSIKRAAGKILGFNLFLSIRITKAILISLAVFTIMIIIDLIQSSTIFDINKYQPQIIAAGVYLLINLKKLECKNEHCIYNIILNIEKNDNVITERTILERLKSLITNENICYNSDDKFDSCIFMHGDRICRMSKTDLSEILKKLCDKDIIYKRKDRYYIVKKYINKVT